jgi:hypothetical protein
MNQQMKRCPKPAQQGGIPAFHEEIRMLRAAIGSYNSGMKTPSAETHAVTQIAKQTGLPPQVVLVLAHLDPKALGLASGFVLGLWIWGLTMFHMIWGGESRGGYLTLMSNYFIGYSVSVPGSVIGFIYAVLVGLVLGYSFARMRNFFVRCYLRYIRRRAEREIVSDLLDHLT